MMPTLQAHCPRYSSHGVFISTYDIVAGDFVFLCYKIERYNKDTMNVRVR